MQHLPSQCVPHIETANLFVVDESTPAIEHISLRVQGMAFPIADQETHLRALLRQLTNAA